MSAPVWNTAPGSIGSIVEGNFFNFPLAATGALYFFLLSGELPPGVALNATTGLVSGNIPLLQKGQVYTFTVRAINTTGVVDRTFSIAVTDKGITWNTPQNLGTIIEKSFFSILISANDPGNLNLTYSLIAGSLPTGLNFYSNGLLTGYVSQINDTTDTFLFTIQADGASGTISQQFSLSITSIGNPVPQWNTIGVYGLGNGIEGGDVGNIFFNVAYSYQLEGTDPFPPGPGPLIYTLVPNMGVLPPGVTISPTGLLSGTLTTQQVALYPFAIQISDGINFITRGFYIRANFVVQDFIYWVVNTASIPINLAAMTNGEVVTFNIGSNEFQITKTFFKTQFQQSMLNNIDKIVGLSVSNTYLIVRSTQGEYTIYVFNSGTTYSVYTMVSVTPGDFTFNIGNAVVGEDSTLQVIAVTTSDWVRYEVNTTSAALPLGFYVNVSTGELQGSTQNQTPGTYTFMLDAYNYTTNTSLVFTVNLESNSNFLPNRLTTRLTDIDKITWMGLNNIELYNYPNVYRQGDYNFGNEVRPEVVILSDVAGSLTSDQIYNLISAELPTSLRPSDYIFTPVVDVNQNVVCECVVLRFADQYDHASLSYTVPNAKNPAPNPAITLAPGGLRNIRQIFFNNSDANETFENWMNYYFTTNISNSSFIITGVIPNFILGDKIMFTNQTLPQPFENGLFYYVIPIDATNFFLAASLNDAQSKISIQVNVNETIDRSGTLSTYIIGTPIVHMNVGFGQQTMNTYNEQMNITPFGYYWVNQTGKNLTDTFFGTLYGHNLNTGDPITFSTLPVPGPFNFYSYYYAIVVDNLTFQLAASKKDALANNPINVTENINPYTQGVYTGSFKKIILTQNNTADVVEDDTRFTIPVNVVFYDDKFLYKFFTASSTNSHFILDNHGLDTGDAIQFKNQTLPASPSPFLNNTIYYVLVIDVNTFKLATTYHNAFAGTTMTVTSTFSGLLEVDNSMPVFINTITSFDFIATWTNSIFVGTQTSTLELGDPIQLEQVITSFPSPFVSGNVYYVIPITEKCFRLASSLLNAQNGTYITFASNFDGNLVLQNNYSEFNYGLYNI